MSHKTIRIGTSFWKTSWPYTPEDISFLEQNFSTKSHTEIAQILCRTPQSIRNKCWRLGFVDTNGTWTKEDFAILDRAYQSSDFIDVVAVAKELNRSIASVQIKASRRGYGNSKRSKVKEKKIKTKKFATKEELLKHQSERQKKWIADNGHPCGMKGKCHTEETKAKISIASIEMNKRRTDDDMLRINTKSAQTRIKNGTQQNMNRAAASWGCGWRDIGGIRKYYRSKWEANYARYLEWLKSKGEIQSWLHEPETFWFEGIKRGCLSYLPDFRVVEKNGSVVYHEVKGWMDDRSKTKIKRMAKYHPHIKLIVIEAKAYNSIKKTIRSIIKDWEVDAKGR